jgi:hypothetical protein
MNPLTLRTAMRDVLAAATAAYDTDAAPKVPARRYLMHGTPTWLGEQLVVWSPGLLPAGPFPLPRLRSVKSTVVPAAQLNIEVVRECWPSADGTNVRMTTPGPDQYTDAAEMSALDAATLFSAIAAKVAAGTLCPSLEGLGTADDYALSPMVPLGPLGKRFGWRLPVAVKLAVT